MEESIFLNNEASSFGGAIYISHNGLSLIMKSSNFEYNAA